MCASIGHMPTHSFGREVANVALRAVAVFVVLGLLFVGSSLLVADESISDGACNIAVVPIEGIIAPYGYFTEDDIITNPATVRDYVTRAENDFFVEGLLFEINSPGGTPVAAEHIAETIDGARLPTVGLVGDMGASGAYLVAAATDHLIASRMSDVGSIGVTMSYLENSIQNENDGLTFVELSTGKFKEAGNPNKPLSDEERAQLEKGLRSVHDSFVDLIAQYREVDRSTISSIADGRTFVGQEAIDTKLIDEFGGRKAAKEHFAEVLQKPVEEISFCEYVPSIPWI